MAQEQNETLRHVPSHRHVGGQIARQAALFSPDSKYFFVIASNDIRVFSKQTGEPTAVLRGHASPVTSLCLNPHNHLQVLSGSRDGTVRVWDFSVSKCLQTIKMPDRKAQVLHLAAPTKKSKQSAGQLFAIVQRKPSKANSCRVAKISLIDGKVEYLFKCGVCRALDCNACGSIVVCIAARKLFVYHIRAAVLHKWSHQRELTCVRVCPSEPIIAVGDQDGRIFQLFEAMKPQHFKPRTVTFHWHSHQVQALEFTIDGAFLLSGGEEAVLVTWNLSSGHRDFLPRLGGMIRGVAASPDGQTYAIATADNQIKLISAVTGQVERTVRGLSFAHSLSLGHGCTELSAGVQIEPRCGLLCLNGSPGQLQFFDALNDRHVGSCDVVPYNFVSRREKERIPVPSIDQVVFSQMPNESAQTHAQWLVTVDRRNTTNTTTTTTDTTLASSIALKFWAYDPRSRSYALNTRVDAPHTAPVSAVAFHPTQPLVCTAGSGKDHSFKIWECVDRPAAPRMTKSPGKDSSGSSSSSSTDVRWRCRSSGFYKSFPIHDCAFSQDGTLLAVSYGQIVTLWDPLATCLLHSLVHPQPQEPVLGVRFLAGKAASLLVSYTQDTLYVWDLLSLRVLWSYRMPVFALAHDPASAHFAVVTQPIQTHSNDDDEESAKQQFCLIFDGASAVPRRVFALPDGAECVSRSLVFQPSPSTGSTLILMSKESKSIVRFDNVLSDQTADDHDTDGKHANAKSKSGKRLPNIFEQLFGKPALPKFKPAKSTASSSNQSTSKLFGAPVHVLPPCSKLLAPFFDRILDSVSGNVSLDPKSDEQQEDNNDQDMHDDSQSSSSSSSSRPKHNDLPDSELFASETAGGFFAAPECAPFVGLFSKQQATSTTSKPKTQTQTKTKTPHKSHHQQNKAASKHKTPKLHNGTHSAASAARSTRISTRKRAKS